jgi:hypothetical protein
MRLLRGWTCALTLTAAHSMAMTSKIGAMDDFFIITNLGLLMTRNLRPHRQHESLNYSSTDEIGRKGE